MATERLGTLPGKIYFTLPDGVTIIEEADNNGNGERRAKWYASQSYAEARNRIGFGLVTISASVGGEDITAVNINGVNQIAGSVATSAAPSTTATDVANAVNAFTPASGPDYTASVVGDTITLFADEASGSSVNGHTVSVSSTNPTTIVVVTQDVDGGGDGSSVNDEATGYRIFLNSNNGAPSGSLVGAQEISKFLIPLVLNGGIIKDEQVISNGVVSFDRVSLITSLKVDTEGAVAADDLDTISAQGFALGDRVIIQGKEAGHVVTVKSGTGNIVLKTGDFDTGGLECCLTLMLGRQTPTSAPAWYEVSRSTASAAGSFDFRSEGLPVGEHGTETTIIPTGGYTTNLVAGTDKEYQVYEGTGTLTDDVNINFDTTGALAGDKFTVQYDATLDPDGNTVTIGGIPLTDNQAETGGWVVDGYYDGVSWDSTIHANIDSSSNTPQIESSNLSSGVVTVDSLDPLLKNELETVDVSFEFNELGDIKIEWPYNGYVAKMTAFVTKEIEPSDDGQICVKNDASITVNTIDMLAGTGIGIGVSVLPTANNTFVDGDVWTFNTAKPSAGGRAKISLKVVRS